MQIVKLYAVMFLSFLFLDILWIGVVAKSLYQKNLSNFLTDQINWYAAFVFYLVFIAGVLFFVVCPNLKEQTLIQTLYKGAFFGLVTYATYDLSNLATVRSWPLSITIIDIAWGIFLTSSVGIIGHYSKEYLLK